MADQRSREQAKKVARRMLDAFNTEGETHLPDSLVAHNVVTHFPHGLHAPERGVARERVPSETALPREAFSDQRFEEQIVISDGELVFIAWDVTATNDGPLFGLPPTGKQVRVSGADVIRVQRGRIVEHWDYYTRPRTHALAQLGLLDEDMQKRLDAEGLLGRGRASGVIR